MQSSFFVPTTQMPIFVLFVSAGVSFHGAFFLWVSLRLKTYNKKPMNFIITVKKVKSKYLKFHQISQTTKTINK